MQSIIEVHTRFAEKVLHWLRIRVGKEVSIAPGAKRSVFGCSQELANRSRITETGVRHSGTNLKSDRQNRCCPKSVGVHVLPLWVLRSYIQPRCNSLHLPHGDRSRHTTDPAKVCGGSNIFIDFQLVVALHNHAAQSW